jgi:hypothetical protein
MLDCGSILYREEGKREAAVFGVAQLHALP